MMLYPLTGSAVTWSEVESALQTSGSYSGDGVTAVCGDDSIEISGGTVDTLWLVSTKFPSVKTYRITDVMVSGPHGEASVDIWAEQDMTVFLNKVNSDGGGSEMTAGNGSLKVYYDGVYQGDNTSYLSVHASNGNTPDI